MRFFYWTDRNPRMEILNDTLRQPLLFAPADAVKAMTFAAFYSAGPRPMSQMLSRGTGCLPMSCYTSHSDRAGDMLGDAVTQPRHENKGDAPAASVSKSSAAPCVFVSTRGIKLL